MNMKCFETLTKNRCLLLYDGIFAVGSFCFTAAFLNADIHNIADVFTKPLMPLSYIPYLLISIAVYYAVMLICGNQRIMWLFAGTRDYLKLSISALFIMLLNLVVSSLFFSGVRFAFLFNLLVFLWCIASRMAVRGGYKLLKIRQHKRSAENDVNVLIIGAGSAGSMLLHDLSTNTESSVLYHVVGFIDNDKAKRGTAVENVRVLGNDDDIASVCANYHVNEIYLAIPSAPSDVRAEILEKCNATGCKLKVMESLENTLTDSSHIITRDVEIEDLLAREPISLDNSAIENDIRDQVVMVTGGGGSIGSELCRQIVRFSPRQLVILDIYENNAYDLQMELREKYPDLNLAVVIASVRDYDRLSEVFRTYRPHIVFHAAAHKHVPLMEFSPAEAVKNNVFGTYNTARCADESDVSKFVMISTDKAVNPTNVMGATKRLCEMVIQAMDKISKTKFVAVRFGNVLGSNGSVIPLFKRQIAHGGPVTVTHKDITRFFMTIPEASQLVIQAAANAKGGEIFILDMGSPVRIYDLAEKIIRLSGFRPNVDIPIKVTGLRPGEKLYEELLMSEEGLTDTEHKKIFIGKPSDITIKDVEEKLAVLSEALATNDPDAVKAAITATVPTYRRTDN